MSATPESLDSDFDKTDIVEEAPEYSPKSEFNKPLIVQEAFKRCSEARSDEMKAGYWNTTVTKDGMPIKTWVKDTRKVYMACVESLRVLLNPEATRNSKYQTAENNLLEELETLFKLYAYSEVLPYKSESGLVWKETGKIYMPSIDATIIRPDPKDRNNFVYLSGYWNHQVNRYLDESVSIYDELFSLMSDLVDSLNYFKQSVNY